LRLDGCAGEEKHIFQDFLNEHIWYEMKHMPSRNIRIRIWQLCRTVVDSLPELGLQPIGMLVFHITVARLRRVFGVGLEASFNLWWCFVLRI
jgi:hypothetical protein